MKEILSQGEGRREKWQEKWRKENNPLAQSIGVERDSDVEVVISYYYIFRLPCATISFSFFFLLLLHRTLNLWVLFIFMSPANTIITKQKVKRKKKHTKRKKNTQFEWVSSFYVYFSRSNEVKCYIFSSLHRSFSFLPFTIFLLKRFIRSPASLSCKWWWSW